MFYNASYLYYLELALQAYCAWHCISRGTQNKWIWLIIFVPVVGSVVYLYSEVFSNRRINTPKINIGAVINPGGKLKKLEDELRFTDTFANRIKLADAYLAAGYTDNAIELYTTSLTGAFAENEHVMAQLMVAYYEQERYDEVIELAKKLYKLPQFIRSKSHILYALALENSGQVDLAEAEFKLMKGRYSYFEARYQYGLFLTRNGREQDASTIFTDMLDEQPHLSPVEKRSNRVWFAKAKEELKKIPVV